MEKFRVRSTRFSQNSQEFRVPGMEILQNSQKFPGRCTNVVPVLVLRVHPGNTQRAYPHPGYFCGTGVQNLQKLRVRV